ncbi:hypothetical protein LTR94_036394, partial [Friedmanniomyces endolithicus]
RLRLPQGRGAARRPEGRAEPHRRRGDQGRAPFRRRSRRGARGRAEGRPLAADGRALHRRRRHGGDLRRHHRHPPSGGRAPPRRRRAARH